MSSLNSYAQHLNEPVSFNHAAQNATTLGELELLSRDSTPTPAQSALLMGTHISGHIEGLVATITVEQAFQNQSDQWMHGRYVFPLPSMAAVNEVEIALGQRVIVGEVQEKKQAQATFAAAKKKGQAAGLVEQHRANLFSVGLANIPPGESIRTRLTYIDRVSFVDQRFQLRLPTTLTPRYIAGTPQQLKLEDIPLQAEMINIGKGWAQATAQVKDAPDITPPQTYSIPAPAASITAPAAELRPHHFSLDLSVNPGMPINAMHSFSHRLAWDFIDGGTVQIRLQEGYAPLDRDLALQWSPRDPALTQAALFQQEYLSEKLSQDQAQKQSRKQQEYYQLLMVTPPQLSQQSLPRDVTYIIDTSGSMGGASIRQAKAALLNALQHLSVNDRFNVIEFNSSYTTLFKHSQYATPNNLRTAQHLITRLDAGGGTEMRGALEYALAQPQSEDRLHQIIFITDGSVGNEAELFQLIDKQLRAARLFTVGIGSAPNSYFMRKAARFGRGFAVQISDLNQVEAEIGRLAERIQQPMMRDLQITWPSEVEQFPPALPDLYAGEPIVVLARSQQPITNLTVTGNLLGQPWQQTLRTTADQHQNTAKKLDVLWARAKVDALMNNLLLQPNTAQQVREDVIQLGIQHHIATRFTSFVAVEKEIIRPEDASAEHENVPNLMPSGSTMAAPQTATAADLMKLSGALLLLLVLLWRTRAGLRWPAEVA